MSEKKNQKISPKSSPGPDLSDMLVTLYVFKSARERDEFYFHVVNILWNAVDERVKDLIREYFNDLMDEDEKEVK